MEQALALIKKAAQSPELGTVEGRGLVEIISRYTQTFLWLQRYDEDKFRAFGACFLVDMNSVFENVPGCALKRPIEEDYGSKVLLLYSAKAIINVNGRTSEIRLSGIRRLAKAVGSLRRLDVCKHCETVTLIHQSTRVE